MARFYTSPSRIAHYFHLECERHLRFSSIPGSGSLRIAEQNAASPSVSLGSDAQQFFVHHSQPNSARISGTQQVPQNTDEEDSVNNALIQKGFAWEETVVNQLIKDRLKTINPSAPLAERYLSRAETAQFLRETPAGFYIYQPTFDPPEDFYPQYGLSRELIELRQNRPDLIEVLPGPNGRRLFRLIDVKASASLRLSHRVQVTLYALELRAILEQLQIDDASVDLSVGAVWLPNQTAPQEFSLARVRPHVEKFLRQDLSRILQTDPEKVSWHIVPRCEGCQFFTFCRQETEITQSVSLLPYLSKSAKSFLRQQNTHNLSELSMLLAKPEADTILAQSAAFAGKRTTVQSQLNALQQKKIFDLEGASLSLPKKEDVRVIVTLQQEPVSNTVYLYGLYVRASDELQRKLSLSGKQQVWISASSTYIEAQKGFLQELHQTLVKVHSYNEAKSQWRDKLSLQTYVYDPQEERLLLEVLLRGLHSTEPEISQAALSLLFHFQDEELTQANHHPDTGVQIPVVALTQALRRLFALPVAFQYRLSDVLQSFKASGARVLSYPYDEKRHAALSNSLRSDLIHTLWQTPSQSGKELIEDTEQRLRAVSSLLNAIRSRAGERLVATPAVFKLPGDWNMTRPLLSRLAFMSRYEGALRCTELRQRRVAPREERLLQGGSILLRSLGGNRFAIEESNVTSIDAAKWPKWLLSTDDTRGEKQQMSFPDYWYRRPFSMPSPETCDYCVPVSVAQIVPDAVSGQPKELFLDAKLTLRSGIIAGRRYLLSERFIDQTSDTIVGFLKKLDAKEDALAYELLLSPKKLSVPLPFVEAVAQRALYWADKMNLTESQRIAYHRICERRGILLWGPPGTGKTRFLASTLSAFLEAHQFTQRPLRIVVCASTHSAVENLMLATQKQLGSFGSLSPFLAKLGRWERDALPGVQLVTETAQVPRLLQRNPLAVVGCTVYRLSSLWEQGLFDLVVIDEASQMRVAEGLLAISALSSSGKLLIAGDDQQLPPIVQGEYPEPLANEPPLHRSIFEIFRPPSSFEQERMCQLTENWRMCQKLTEFSSMHVYGDAYRCANEEVAEQRLPWSLKSDDPDDFLSFCLDPEYPLVFASLEGLSTPKENLPEAHAVALLVHALRQGLNIPLKENEAAEAAFVDRGVFVVSPHRAQIFAIRNALAKHQITQLPLVDTVDKIQGQEALAVIVSYGVSDPDFALREANFIYSLNRLNVAMTRARTKCIVFLPRPLIDAAPQVLENEDAARGLSYMRSLWLYSQSRGEARRFSTLQDTSLNIWRVRQLTGEYKTMKSEWLLTMKPSFLNEWLGIPQKDAHNVQEKFTLLLQDPTPDGKLKKQLRNMSGKLCRLRVGDFRIFYTFQKPYISLLALRRRSEDTYDEKIEAESLGGLDATLEEPRQAVSFFAPPPTEKKPLPTPITKELLASLQIPSHYEERLLSITTEDDLLNCGNVPPKILNKILDTVFPKDSSDLEAQPTLVAGTVEELLRFKSGDLMGFLLKLNPEQEKYVTFGLKSSGPTLLKGGPGTGKSTVALYRVKAILDELLAKKETKIRILFTTYTNALVTFSQNLLTELLGVNAKYVEVKTADKLAADIIEATKKKLEIIDYRKLQDAVRDVISQATFTGNRLQQKAQKQAIDRIPIDYLLEEITSVIEARRLAGLEQYLAAPRPGRKLALNATQRTAVYRIYENLKSQLFQRNLWTWQHIRNGALELVAQGKGPTPYEAIIVDEAQDLDPTSLRLIASLCRAPNRLFLTADTNQSIYGNGLRWNEIHEQLNFQGRTGILKDNHRSTREISEAAYSYLSGASLDQEVMEPKERGYVHNGPVPVVRSVASLEDEAKLLARFLPNASKAFRLGYGSCAVFCPTEASGRELAERLKSLNLQATFMSSQDLDLGAPGVKVMTLKSSKGLEFPIVAIAGFIDTQYPPLRQNTPEEISQESLERERRTLFVAMTRAMRALLVILPAETTSPLLTGFDPNLWNTTDAK